MEKEYGVTQLQRMKAFQRMVVYGLVAKDVPRKLLPQMPKTFGAVNAEWSCLRSIILWDEDHPRPLGLVEAEAQRDFINIGRFFDLCVGKRSELSEWARRCEGRVVLGGSFGNVDDDRDTQQAGGERCQTSAQ